MAGSNGPRPSTRWHQVATSLSGDDEFSQFSTDPRSRKPKVMTLDPTGKPLEPDKRESFWAGAFRWIFR